MGDESFPVPSPTIKPILVEDSVVINVEQIKKIVKSGSTLTQSQWSAFIKKLEEDVSLVCDAIQTIAKKYTQISPTDTKDVKLAKLKQSEELIKFLENTRDYVSKFLAELHTQITTEGINKCYNKMNEAFQSFFKNFEK